MSEQAAMEFLDELGIGRERPDDRDCDCGVPPFEGAGQHATTCRCCKPYSLDDRIEKVAERFEDGAIYSKDRWRPLVHEDCDTTLTYGQNYLSLPDLQAHARNLAALSANRKDGP
jgi:hypothetical protein